MSGSQDPRHVAGHDLGAADVWAELDEWEPEPISLDFNRRLYERIQSVERKNGRFLSLPIGSAFVLFALLILFSSSTRPLASRGSDTLFLEQNGFASAAPETVGPETVGPETVGMVQTLYDLEMLQTLNSEQSL